MRKPVSFSMEACPILSATHSVAHTEAEQSVLESAFMAKRSVMERLWGHILWPERSGEQWSRVNRSRVKRSRVQRYKVKGYQVKRSGVKQPSHG